MNFSDQVIGLKGTLLVGLYNALKATSKHVAVTNAMATNGSNIVTEGQPGSFATLSGTSLAIGSNIPPHTIATVLNPGVLQLTNVVGANGFTAEQIAGVPSQNDTVLIVVPLTSSVKKGTLISIVNGGVPAAYSAVVTADAYPGDGAIFTTPAHVSGALVGNETFDNPTQDIEFFYAIAQGDGVNKTFVNNVALNTGECISKKQPLKVTWEGASEVLTDNGSGKLISNDPTNLDAGSVDYHTGTITANFKTAPTNNFIVYADFATGPFDVVKPTDNNNGLFNYPNSEVNFYSEADGTTFNAQINLVRQNPQPNS